MAAAIDPDMAFIRRVPEDIFGVVEIAGTSSAVTGRMRCGNWLATDDGYPAPGGIGVFVDAAVGGAAVAHRPSGGWAVTTDLSITFCAEIPTADTDLTVKAHTVHHDGHAGVSAGSIFCGDTAVAAVVERIAYIPTPPSAALPGQDSEHRERRGSTLRQLDATVLDDGFGITVGENATNPGGALHGGVSVYLTELAASAAVRDQKPALVPATLQISYARPGKAGETVIFRPQVLHLGRNSATVDVLATAPGDKVVTRSRLTYHPSMSSPPSVLLADSASPAAATRCVTPRRSAAR